MRLGLCFDGFYSIHEMIELAGLADEGGMESIWMSDHLCFRDSLTTSPSDTANTRTGKDEHRGGRATLPAGGLWRPSARW